MQIKKAALRAFIQAAPSWQQALIFWLAAVSGAGAWALLLLAFGLRVQQPLTQAAYVLGLYIWLLMLSGGFRKVLSLPPLPAWRPVLKLIQGAAFGISCLSLLLLLQLSLGWASWLGPKLNWQLIIPQVLVMALGVAWIEERVFRGLMLDLFKSQGETPALQIQAGIYAGLHLLRTDLGLSGWLTALASLWLTGLILGELRRITGSLAASLGLHAGWVVLTSFLAWSGCFYWRPETHLWSGSGNPAYGLSGLILLALIYGLLLKLPAQRHPAK